MSLKRPTGKFKKYHVISHADTPSINLDLDNYMSEGWDVYGELEITSLPNVSSTSRRPLMYTQVVVIYNEPIPFSELERCPT